MEIFMKSSWKNLELAQPVEEGYFVEEGMSEKKGNFINLGLKKKKNQAPTQYASLGII